MKKAVAIIILGIVYFGFFWALPIRVTVEMSSLWIIRVAMFHGVIGGLIGLGLLVGWAICQIQDVDLW